jgi:glycerate kinase
MRILVAPDAFKGSLSAARAAEAMAAGIREVIPDAAIDMLPLADGGEGTLDALLPYLLHGESNANDEEYVVYHDDGCDAALIESAHCLGLTLPSMQSLDVDRRGSRALGECVLQCLDAGIRRFVIALGGSATNDAGLGLLLVLGLRALDDRGIAVSPDLHGLTRVAGLDVSAMDARLGDCDLTILCDVDAPLCGPKGATHGFGSQKGLPIDRLASVDQAVAWFAGLAEASFGVSTRSLPGSGAAGGLGFALSLLGGRLVPGAAYVIERAGLAQRLKGVDWVLTGEGRSDAQTLTGKLPMKVAEAARAVGAKVALISGDIVDAPRLAGHFDAVVPARPQAMPVERAMDDAASLLCRATAVWASSLAMA